MCWVDFTGKSFPVGEKKGTGTSQDPLILLRSGKLRGRPGSSQARGIVRGGY
jgi:hypothetical protein